VDLITGGGLGLRHIGEPLAIGRPARRFFRNIRRARQIPDFSGCGGDGEQVPLFIAVVVGLEGDPFTIRRPASRNLPLIGDGQLQRPTATGIDDPQVLPPTGVGCEADSPAIRRPPPGADAARMVEPLQRQLAESRFCGAKNFRIGAHSRECKSVSAREWGDAELPRRNAAMVNLGVLSQWRITTSVAAWGSLPGSGARLA
jgi:hypothetical protein